MAADLTQHSWSDNTWATRSSQWRKRVGFCDDRRIFPASEGDVLAYIGFMKLKGMPLPPHYRNTCQRCRGIMNWQGSREIRRLSWCDPSCALTNVPST
jgi:hypothetical protein